MTSLYDFSAEMQAQIDYVTELLESGIEAESDEVQNALKAIFATKEEFSDKAEKVGLFIINTLAEAAIAKGEADRLTKIAKAKIAKAESLKNYLLNHMLATGVTDVKSPICPIKVKQNPWSVHVESVDSLPPEFQRIKTVVEADKKALLATRESDTKIQGVTFDRAMSIKIG